mmetsp:Transcript_9054/g.10247  ORF Transcript_9054/g.10247 Transcript_9054/m.10247 type:complete len:406 (+) Transcript_9054:36-1253(+)|eukprot:CAMPEP_0205820646 /NCGR_PEP_ID=MMETSP0206-20130828/3314_1 /ASSEMBLY_ACC=CAM_ASM_000279 /TAXON_ID=36767 /ORGANISM="Euplotes focardii, Strain TN1" /LENGTH=405 /DNA_ID=CAMNT_0053115571 /DNA_START=33 /DNA_END=1250 /DNA_ORIENTATION=-
MGGGSDPLLNVRAVTTFVVLDKDSTKWESLLVAAATFNGKVADALKVVGYDVQSLRIVANPFAEFLDVSSKEAALRGMQHLQTILSGPHMPPFRIRFAVGAATTKADLALVPFFIKHFGDLANVCINIGADGSGVPDPDLCDAAADCVQELARMTERGEGNFNFTVNFNCPPLIPYFPAGYNTNFESFAIGIEYPDLLVHVLNSMKQGQEEKELDWDLAFDAMLGAVQTHVNSIVRVANQCSASLGKPFSGLDSSPAPHKDIKSLLEVFRLLGVNFGGPGTLTCSQFLTRLFKSVRGVPLIGFSGLMLAVLEDSGLAEAAIRGAYDITALNAYSAVCGIGLDCVPVPGAVTRKQLVACMQDTGTLAFKLDKPLTVRLFPCPGLVAGDMTEFTSPDLVNTTVFSVE